MIKFRTESYGIDIEKVEITKETEKTIWYERDVYGEKRIEQERKDSDYRKYHDTFQDAKNYLIDRCEGKIKHLEHDLQSEKNELVKIMDIKE